MHLVDFIIRVYHDVRLSERQVRINIIFKLNRKEKIVEILLIEHNYHQRSCYVFRPISRCVGKATSTTSQDCLGFLAIFFLKICIKTISYEISTHPVTCHAGTEVEQRYSSTHS